jgi:hypothetical protein
VAVFLHLKLEGHWCAFGYFGKLKKEQVSFISLAVHIGIIILVNNQLDALFPMYVFISLLYMFRATPLIISRIELH